MKVLIETTLQEIIGGADLPINPPRCGPSEAAIAAILALFWHPVPAHMSD